MPNKAFVDALRSGDRVLLAEGYLFELQRRCYLSGGDFVPDVVLDHPEVVRELTEEYVNAGSDVALALTYYGHRQKMSVVKRESDVVALNQTALRIAKEVADKHGCFFAGNVCNNALTDPDSPELMAVVRSHLQEQVDLAKEAGVDFILAETFNFQAETLLAAEVIRESGVPFVVNVAASEDGKTAEGIDVTETLRRVEGMGAAAVGLNCFMGPGEAFYEQLRAVRRACSGPISAVPVPFRTTPEHPKMFQLRLPGGSTTPGKRAFPDQLDAFICSLDKIREFGAVCKEIDVAMPGICCGNMPIHFRALAESLGRTPRAANKDPNMERHMTQQQTVSEKTFRNREKHIFGAEGY